MKSKSLLFCLFIVVTIFLFGFSLKVEKKPQPNAKKSELKKSRDVKVHTNTRVITASTGKESQKFINYFLRGHSNLTSWFGSIEIGLNPVVFQLP